jgi:hypothetical protein
MQLNLVGANANHARQKIKSPAAQEPGAGEKSQPNDSRQVRAAQRKPGRRPGNQANWKLGPGCRQSRELLNFEFIFDRQGL